MTYTIFVRSKYDVGQLDRSWSTMICMKVDGLNEGTTRLDANLLLMYLFVFTKSGGCAGGGKFEFHACHPGTIGEKKIFLLAD